MSDFELIEAPLIDPRNEDELVVRGMDRTFVASKGQLNDFSLGSPARALIEGLSFAGAEILYYASQLPLALLIAFLNLMEVQRGLGSNAQATLEFSLSAPLTTPYGIPQGFVVSTSDSQLQFATDSQLVIVAGQVNGAVSATCLTPGTVGNVAAYTLTNLSQPLAYISVVTNPQAATGGADEESAEDVKARGLAAIRRRNLVTADDYEEETRTFFGPGSVAKAIGNLGADPTSFELGTVHVFALDAAGATPNRSSLLNLRLHLQEKTHVSIAAVTSAVVLIPLGIHVVVSLVPGSLPDVVANEVYEILAEYLRPGNLPVGETVLLKEVEFQVRLAEGVEFVQTITLNDLTLNVPLPQEWAAASLGDVQIDCVAQGTVQRIADRIAPPSDSLTYTFFFGGEEI